MKEWKTFQRDLVAAAAWQDKWRVTFHHSKRRVQRLGRRSGRPLRNHRAAGESCEELDGEKDLGILIQSTLYFF